MDTGQLRIYWWYIIELIAQWMEKKERFEESREDLKGWTDIKDQMQFYFFNGITSLKATKNSVLVQCCIFPKAINLIPVFFSVSFKPFT